MHSSALRLLSLALSLGAAALLPAQQPQGPKAPPLPAAVILLPSGKTLIMPTSNGGCEAIDAVSGKSQWQVGGVADILGLHRDKLLVLQQTDNKQQKVRIAALDLGSGKSLSTSADFTFQAPLVWDPPWKDTVPPDRDNKTWSPVSNAGYTFAVRPLLWKDELFLVWQARNMQIGGAFRPAFGGEGAVRVDLESGKASALPRGDKVPQEAKLLGRSDGTMQPADGLQFQVITQEEKPKLPGAVIRQKYLQALRDGKVVWERALGWAAVEYLSP
jgi:hypothetical protein